MNKYKLRIDKDLHVDYLKTVNIMDQHVTNLISNNAENLIWLLEYNHIYTAGISSNEADLLNKNVNVVHTKRGGKYTYHGPGQQICYLILNLKKIFDNKPDLREYLQIIGQINIDILQDYNIKARFCDKNIGIWVDDQKITSIGIRLKKWIVYHGFALNINTDLQYFNNIVPCGIQKCQMTSMQKILNNSYIDQSIIIKKIINNIERYFNITLNSN